MQRLMTRAWVEIDLGALVRNGDKFARAAGVPLLPMVKADAYGLGAVRVAMALQSMKTPPWGFGVATLDEADELRRAGIELSILAFNPILPTQFDEARRTGVRPVLGDPVTIEKWRATGQPWHLAIDTGMSRAGIPWRDTDAIRAAAATHPPEGVCTHFHSAELPDGSREEQERRFRDAVAMLPAKPSLIHADNSPAIEHRAPSPFQLARPGIFLYGVGSANGATIEPEPVVAMRARIVEIRIVKEGDSVGYDASWRAPRAGRIATVSLGYADGYRRALGNHAHGLLRGERVPVVGFVTMDMTMVDVTDRKCEAGDVVTFLGKDGGETLTVADVAGKGGFSPYELLTGLRQRLPRLYSSNDDR